MEKNKQLVPKRRFKEFENDGEWEQHKLGNISQYFNGGSFEDNVQDNGRYELVTLKSIDMDGNFVSSGRYIDIEAPTLIKDTLVMILSEQSPGLLGMTARISRNNVYVLNQRVAEIRPNKEIDSYFLSTGINKNQQYFSRHGAGTKVQNISKFNVENFELLCPSVDEQKRIGLFFEELDNLINLQKNKIEKSKKLKNSYLSDMFPKDAEKYPKKRFQGFTEPWEKYHLGELSDIVRGASPRPIKDPKWFDANSDVGWLRISDVTEQDGRIHYLEQKISKAGQEKTRVLKSPYLLLSIAATVGKPVINYVHTGVHDGFLIFLNPKFDQEFMFQWLEMFRVKWQKYGQPGSQVNLNSDIVKNQAVMIPSVDEQAKIASFFKNLDAQIDLEEQKLTKLEQLKPAYLNELFV